MYTNTNLRISFRGIPKTNAPCIHNNANMYVRQKHLKQNDQANFQCVKGHNFTQETAT